LIARRIVTILLVLSVTMPLMTYSANAQVSTSLTLLISSSTSTSYTTYVKGVTQFTTTTTAKVYDGRLVMSSVLNPGCGANFLFNAKPGDKISISFTSDIPIEFYLVPVDYGVDAFCVVYSYGIPPSLEAASHRTSYSLEWSPSVEYYQVNHSTQFYLYFFNRQLVPATVLLTVKLTNSQPTSSNIYSTETSWLTILMTQTQSIIMTAMSTSSPASITGTTQNLWILLPFIVLIVLAIVFFSMKNRRPGNTQTR